MLPERLRRSFLVDMDALAAKWRQHDAAAKDAATMIVDCVYPSLAQLPALLQHASATAPLNSKARTIAKQATAPPKPAPSMIVHEPAEWDTEAERRFAEDPRFRRYKENKGWPLYYDSRATLQQYFDDVGSGIAHVVQDYRTIGSKELLDMVSCLARYVDPALFTATEQGKAFTHAVLATATPQQIRMCNTRDLTQKLLVAHHPEWQSHYSWAWNTDATTENEIARYLERWPALPPALLPTAQQPPQ